MRFSCVKEKLERAITIAERFTAKNITLPILGNILLESRESTLLITATNLEQAVQVTIPGKGQAGSVCVSGKIFSSLVQSLKEDTITLEEKQGNMTVKTNTRDTRINGMPTDGFPLIPKIKKISSLQLDALLLKQGFESVLPAVSSSEFKPELSGVFLSGSGKLLKLVATDTFRLAEKKLPVSEPPSGLLSCIIPQRVAQELARIISEGEEEIEVLYGDNQILFNLKGIQVISRTIEGNFPEYGNIIPQQFETTCFLETSEFINAVRSSSIFSSKIQEVTLKFSKKQIEITASNPEIGEHKIILPGGSVGKETKVSFNYRYLLDGIGAMHEKEVFLGVNENAAAVVKNKNDDSLLYVLMPIRLS